MVVSKRPTYYESRDGRVAIKLDMLPGDMALVAGTCPVDDTTGVMVFVFSDASATIIGTAPKEVTIKLLKQAIEILAIVPDQEIPS